MSPTPSLGERERERRGRQTPNPANRSRRVPTPDETADGDDVPCSAALHRSRRVHLPRDPECAVIPTDGVSSLLWKGRCSFHGCLGFTTLTGSPFTQREDPNTGVASDDFSPQGAAGYAKRADMDKIPSPSSTNPVATIAEHRVSFY
ncbi:hypothetical protein U1Q18_015106 [Sarracenia purpurea var. burkii]